MIHRRRAACFEHAPDSEKWRSARSGQLFRFYSFRLHPSLFISRRLTILYHLGVLRRKRPRAPLFVHHDVISLALGQQRPVARPKNLVGEFDGARARLDDPRANDDLVVVPGRAVILHARFDYWQMRVFLPLHVAVIKPVIAAQFDPADLEPDQVIRVINNAGLIGLGVADAQPRLAPFVMFSFVHIKYGVNQVVQQLSGSVPRAVASGYWQSRRSLSLAVLTRRLDQRSTTFLTEY